MMMPSVQRTRSVLVISLAASFALAPRSLPSTAATRQRGCQWQIAQSLAATNSPMQGANATEVDGGWVGQPAVHGAVPGVGSKQRRNG